MTQQNPQNRVPLRLGALPRRAKPTAHSKLSPALIIGSAAAVGILLFLGVIGLIAAFALAPDRIASNVAVAGIDLGGKTGEAAERALQQALDDTSITAVDGERTWPLQLSDLGASIDIEVTLQAAQNAQAGDDVQPVYTIDLNQAQSGLMVLSELANIAALPGTPPQYGRSLEIPVMLDRLRLDPTGELADGVLELNMIEVEPPEEEPMSRADGGTTTYVVQAGQELGLIAREYGVTVEQIVELNGITDPDLLYVGQELLIPASGPYIPADIPEPSTSQGKAIVVSTTDQRIYAFENGEMVHTHLVSTGLAATPTVLGDYNIYVKYVADDMSGPDYFLPQVPYTMYFFQGYGIHGTYWHNAFGRPMSHGCVNLPVGEAEWFFNWAEVGTPVRVV
jgi:nucleoid-associated protein YgaU